MLDMVRVNSLPAANHEKVQDHSPDEDFISPVCQVDPVLPSLILLAPNIHMVPNVESQ